jgi:hypothetical protein
VSSIDQLFVEKGILPGTAPERAEWTDDIFIDSSW